MWIALAGLLLTHACTGVLVKRDRPNDPLCEEGYTWVGRLCHAASASEGDHLRHPVTGTLLTHRWFDWCLHEPAREMAEDRPWAGLGLQYLTGQCPAQHVCQQKSFEHEEGPRDREIAANAEIGLPVGYEGYWSIECVPLTAAEDPRGPQAHDEDEDEDDEREDDNKRVFRRLIRAWVRLHLMAHINSVHNGFRLLEQLLDFYGGRRRRVFDYSLVMPDRHAVDELQHLAAKPYLKDVDVVLQDDAGADPVAHYGGCESGSCDVLLAALVTAARQAVLISGSH